MSEKNTENDETAFKYVEKKKRKKKSQNNNRTVQVPIDSNQQKKNFISSKFPQFKVQIKSSNFFLDIKKKLDSIISNYNKPLKKVVCYGIGNFLTQQRALYQLSLIHELFQISTLNQSNIKFLIFDPIFTPIEKEVLKELGWTLIDKNEQGKHIIRNEEKEISNEIDFTLFYMPHCAHAMYNNLLWMNWNIQCLSNLIIIGNIFSDYPKRVQRRNIDPKVNYIERILPFTKEIYLTKYEILEEAFNDTCIHLFPNDKLEKSTDAFWKQKQEPSVDSDEIILT